jgi:hypothetical protein
VTGFYLNITKIKQLQQENSYVDDASPTDVQEMLACGLFPRASQSASQTLQQWCSVFRCPRHPSVHSYNIERLQDNVAILDAIRKIVDLVYCNQARIRRCCGPSTAMSSGYTG